MFDEGARWKFFWNPAITVKHFIKFQPVDIMWSNWCNHSTLVHSTYTKRIKRMSGSQCYERRLYHSPNVFSDTQKAHSSGIQETNTYVMRCCESQALRIVLTLLLTPHAGTMIILKLLKFWFYVFSKSSLKIKSSFNTLGQDLKFTQFLCGLASLSNYHS